MLPLYYIRSAALLVLFRAKAKLGSNREVFEGKSLENHSKFGETGFKESTNIAHEGFG